MTIILASTSPYRASLLRDAGLEFKAVAAKIDERAVEAPLVKSGATPEDIAEVLAQAKALDVSNTNRSAFTIGADQTLSLDGEQLHKPKNMDEARRHLLSMSEKTHQINSAIAIAQNNEIVWSHVSLAHMQMRKLSPPFIGRHLAAVGDVALTSVGAYQIEGHGVQLFEKIDGDYFTIVGLPLLPLLAKLRELGAIDG